MKIPKFKNRPNEHVLVDYGDKQIGVWVSRANSVDGIVLAIADDGIRVLITKRSNTMYDSPNKFCVPCGYLDWEETRYEAMIREVYEETSLYLPNYSKYNIFDNSKQPFIVKDSPKDNVRQNISNIYLTVLDFRGNMGDFPVEIEKFTCRETALVKWLPLIDFYNIYNIERDWAFNHEFAIASAVHYFNEKYTDNI